MLLKILTSHHLTAALYCAVVAATGWIAVAQVEALP